MSRAGIPRPKARRMTTLEIKQEITRRLKFIIPTHGREWLTTYEVARLIGRARSSKLQRILDEMVEMKRLECRQVQRKNRRPGREYRLAFSQAYPQHKTTRNVLINGQAVPFEEYGLWQ